MQVECNVHAHTLPTWWISFDLLRPMRNKIVSFQSYGCGPFHFKPIGMFHSTLVCVCACISFRASSSSSWSPSSSSSSPSHYHASVSSLVANICGGLNGANRDFFYLSYLESVCVRYFLFLSCILFCEIFGNFFLLDKRIQFVCIWIRLML